MKSQFTCSLLSLHEFYFLFLIETNYHAAFSSVDLQVVTEAIVFLCCSMELYEIRPDIYIIILTYGTKTWFMHFDILNIYSGGGERDMFNVK